MALDNYRYAYLMDQEVINHLLTLLPALQATITTDTQGPRFHRLPEPIKNTCLHKNLSEIQNNFTYQF